MRIQLSYLGQGLWLVTRTDKWGVREMVFNGWRRSSWKEIELCIERWNQGWFIQEAFPMLSPEEREFILTGLTAEEWEAVFDEGLQRMPTEDEVRWEQFTGAYDEYVAQPEMPHQQVKVSQMCWKGGRQWSRNWRGGKELKRQTNKAFRKAARLNPEYAPTKVKFTDFI